MPDMNIQKSPFYRGNQNLHKKGVTIEYTPEQLLEIKRCRDDIVYFASKYFTIVHVDKGKMIIPLTDYQKELLRSIQDNRFSILLQSRQSFKCCKDKTPINIRNKDTGEIVSTTIGDLYETTKKDQM